jgi:hypothetical protein
MIMTYRFVDDLSDFDPKARQVIAEADPSFPGAIVFQVLEHQAAFTEAYGEYLDEYNRLREYWLWGKFMNDLHRNGWECLWLPSADELLTAWLIPPRR